MRYTIENARKLLVDADVFFGPDEEVPELAQTINLNDVWGWACADGHYVSDEELPVIAGLFWEYGWCGILYWCSEYHGGISSEFYDVNRQIEFVRQEETLKKKIPSSSQRAYTKYKYALGVEKKWWRFWT